MSQHLHSLLVAGCPEGVAGHPATSTTQHAGSRTARWQEGLKVCAALAAEREGVQPVAVMDREGDIVTRFRYQQDQGTYDLRVHFQHDRLLGPDQPRRTLAVPRQSARTGSPRRAPGLCRPALAAPDHGADHL